MVVEWEGSPVNPSLVLILKGEAIVTGRGNSLDVLCMSDPG